MSVEYNIVYSILLLISLLTVLWSIGMFARHLESTKKHDKRREERRIRMERARSGYAEEYRLLQEALSDWTPSSGKRTTGEDDMIREMKNDLHSRVMRRPL